MSSTDSTVRKAAKKNSDCEQKSELLLIRFEYVLLFVPLINWSYNVCLMPFKLEFDGEKYNVHVNKIQKIFCKINYVALLIANSVDLAGAQVNTFQENPLDLFTLCSLCTTLAMCILYMSAISKEPFQNSLLALINANIHTNLKKAVKIVRAAKIIYTVCFCMTVYFFFRITFFDSFNFSLSVKNYIKGVTKNYHINCIDSLCYENPFVIGLGIFHIISSFLRHHVWDICTQFCLTSSVVIYYAVEELNVASKLSLNKGDCQKVVRSYLATKKIIGTVNELNGSFLLPFFINVLAYESTLFVAHWENCEWDLKIVHALYTFVQTFFILLLSSESHHKGQMLFNTLRSNNNDGILKQLEYLLDYDCFGLKAGQFFVVNYGFVGNSASVLITYMLIVLQFSNKPN